MQTIAKQNLTAVLAVLFAASTVLGAEDPKVLQQKLESKYTLTVINAEGEVVTQGVVLTLKKSGLTTGGVKACPNDYKNGLVTAGGNVLTRCVKVPGVITGAMRGFVKGEKLYVTRIVVKDGIIFTLISDPIADVRYKADLKFEVAKGTTPDFEQADQMIAEVFTVTPPDNPSPPRKADDTVLPKIEDPKPVTEDPILPKIEDPKPVPQTVSLGDSIDQVIAKLGQPATVADVGKKKIYTYKNPNLKVTFVDGKVTDMQ